ncbi:MAG: HAMP domain-containing protein [Candidatus Riflebacteria bacterium]|nr:HAMP domain-containing protein [Candidatus Riflebacteria bacterium]
MGNGVAFFMRSVAFRLLLYLLPVIGAVTVVYAMVSFNTTRTHLTDLAERDVQRTSELIKRATHYGMLLNRKEDIHHTIRNLARSPDVASIRVYDKQGTIIFSAADGEIGTKVNQRAEACVNCHAQGLTTPSVEPSRRFRQFQSHDGERILGLISPIRNETSCSTAACHAHRADQTILGVLDVQMSMGFMERAISSARSQLTWATLAMLLIVALGTGLFINRVVVRPVLRIYAGTQKVAAGDLQTQVEVRTDDELGRLGKAFNRMTNELRTARQELTAWSDQLEKRVVEKTEQLGRVQRQVAHMDKMASLGKLAATVAHELNNPLAGILNYAKLVDRQLKGEQLPDESRKELGHFVELIQRESVRCGGIVRNLLSFARQSSTATAPAHLDEIVQRSLMLLKHKLELAEIKLETALLGTDDELICDAGQIQQALIALMMNAVEAMNGVPSGVLGVRLRSEGDRIEIAISDTGVGIAADKLDQIFEPFYSTKGEEGGVGLGLAVVYGVMRSHGYDIAVESQAGKGTTFRLRLTRQPHPPQQEPPPLVHA